MPPNTLLYVLRGTKLTSYNFSGPIAEQLAATARHSLRFHQQVELPGGGGLTAQGKAARILPTQVFLAAYSDSARKAQANK